MKSALIIMDMQYDFCEGGPMSHDRSLVIIPMINRMRENYNHVIFVKKQLQNNHSIFKQYGGTYPIHCVKGTNGEKIHDDLITKNEDIVIHRGTLQKYDSNSAFYNAEQISNVTRLKQMLNGYDIKNLYFCGNSMDSSIYSTIIDAVNYNFKCYIIKNAVTSSNESKMDECINYLKTLDVSIIEFEY